MPSIVAPPEIAANKANHLFIELSTGGTVEIVLRPDLAPHHVERIQALVRRGFYNGLTFHRVIPGFMAQGGDPKGTGEGGSELPDLKAEFTAVPFLRGISERRGPTSPDSANSQFFIMYAPRPELDGNYTVMGRVVSRDGCGRCDCAGRAAGGADENCEGLSGRLMPPRCVSISSISSFRRTGSRCGRRGRATARGCCWSRSRDLGPSDARATRSPAVG